MAGTGFTALDRIYAPGLDRPLQALGGSCGNVLVSLAMLGHRVAPIITLGTDMDGDFLVREFHGAGSMTDLICRKSDMRSPVIVEHVDPLRVQHWFSSTCPETLEAVPHWRSIEAEQVWSARGVLEEVSVFYVDRLSWAIVLAMEAANNAGALVFFEPAGSYEGGLLARALQTVSILKVSDETRGVEVYGSEITSLAPMLVIRTHGARGLTVSFAGTNRFSPAHSTARLIDSCGSGDMVTIGLLDYLLRRSSNGIQYSAEEVFAGIQLGQRLAALNCAFVGARGLFHALGRERVQSGVDGGVHDSFVAAAMTFGPYEGY